MSDIWFQIKTALRYTLEHTLFRLLNALLLNKWFFFLCFFFALSLSHFPPVLPLPLELLLRLGSVTYFPSLSFELYPLIVSSEFHHSL